jgi:hypothetical protein
MVRSFSSEPVGADVVDRLLQAALRSPTAGHTGGTAWVVLEGPAQTTVYFDATTDEDWRRSYSTWIEGLQRAPVVLLAYASPEAYVDRYAEPDKRDAGLGEDAEAWPMPYWYGDAAFGVMAVLLGRAGSTSPAGGACSAPSCSGIPTGRTTGRRRSTVPGHAAPSASTAAGGETGAYLAGQPTRLESVCAGPSCQRAMAHNRSDNRLR